MKLNVVIEQCNSQMACKSHSLWPPPPHSFGKDKILEGSEDREWDQIKWQHALMNVSSAHSTDRGWVKGKRISEYGGSELGPLYVLSHDKDHTCTRYAMSQVLHCRLPWWQSNSAHLRVRQVVVNDLLTQDTTCRRVTCSYSPCTASWAHLFITWLSRIRLYIRGN